MGMVFNNIFAFFGFMGIVSVKIHLLVSCFAISGFMSMIFRKYSPDLWVYFREISPDLWVVLSRFEWHNPVSWKLK